MLDVEEDVSSVEEDNDPTSPSLDKIVAIDLSRDGAATAVSKVDGGKMVLREFSPSRVADREEGTVLVA